MSESRIGIRGCLIVEWVCRVSDGRMGGLFEVRMDMWGYLIVGRMC